MTCVGTSRRLRHSRKEIVILEVSIRVRGLRPGSAAMVGTLRLLESRPVRLDRIRSGPPLQTVARSFAELQSRVKVGDMVHVIDGSGRETTIHAAAPKAEESISYGMSAFRLKRKLIAGFKAAANHCSFYPMSGDTGGDTRERFDRLRHQPRHNSILRRGGSAGHAHSQTGQGKNRGGRRLANLGRCPSIISLRSGIRLPSERPAVPLRTDVLEGAVWSDSTVPVLYLIFRFRAFLAF